MTKPTESRRSRLLSFRMEDTNLDSIDRLATTQGVSRSQWIRQAVLAELVLELAGAEAHKNFARHAPLEDPASDEELGEPAMEELGDRPPLTQMTLAELRAAAEADEEAHKCQ